jgi:hypothetical protein
MATGSHSLVLSVDLDEWYHSRRWIDGEQVRAVPDTRALFQKLYGTDTPRGELIEPTTQLLDMLDRHKVKATFFVLGEIAGWFPDLVREIAHRGHEIGCHGLHHVDMTVLGREEFARQLDQAVETIERITARRPIGYRAPNLVYEPWATRVLESRGFLYDTTVCVSRPIGGKYRGWAHSPHHPYHASYEAIGTPGTAQLVELPLPSFPIVRISAGSGILTRVIGFHWTMTALKYWSRRGDTGFYFHPWELVRPGQAARGSWKQALFYRHAGPWMMQAVDRILHHFSGRIVTAEQAARGFLERR